MLWKIEWLQAAREDIKNLDNSIQKRVFKTIINKLEKDPLRYGNDLGNKSNLNLAGLRKIRPVDGYRIVYWVDDLKKQVLILTVAKRERKEVYKITLERIIKIRNKTSEEFRAIKNLLEK